MTTTSNLNWWVAKRDEILKTVELVTKDDDVIIEAAKTAHKTGISPTAAEKLNKLIDSADLKTDAGKELRFNINQFIVQASNQYANDIMKEADSLKPIFNKITVLTEQTNKLNDLITKLGNETDVLKNERGVSNQREEATKQQLQDNERVFQKRLAELGVESNKLISEKQTLQEELTQSKQKLESQIIALNDEKQSLQEKFAKSEKELKIENSTLKQQIETLRQFNETLEAIQNQPPPPPSQTSVVGVGVKQRLQELMQKKPCAEGVDDVIYVMLGERCTGKDRMKFLQESLTKIN